MQNQLMRDQELIKLMEKNPLQKAKAFWYLYKEHQKEISATIQKRDEELESIVDYKEKLWIESIDLVKMYQAQGEFE